MTPTRIERILAHVRGPRILDVGCASTHVRPESTRWLHGRLVEEFGEVVGIDRDPEGVRRMREAGYGPLFVADADRLAVRGAFDTIVAGEVLEHLGEPAAFLRGAREALAADGRIVLTTPYPFSALYVLYALKNFPRTCENPEHVAWFCPATLSELVGRCGLEVVHWELVEDYKPGAGSAAYRAFVRLMALSRRVAPERIRANAMLFVLVRR